MKKLALILSFLFVAGLSFAGSPKEMTDLQKADPLRKNVESVSQKWGDENISSSIINLKGFSLRLNGPDREEALRTFAPVLLKTLFESLEGEPFKAKTTDSTVKTFNPEAAKMAAELVSGEGFCYDPSNKENLKSVQRDVNKALVFLSLTPGTDMVAVAHSRIRHDGEFKNVNLFVFYSVKSGKAVSIFVREGSM